MSDLVEQPKRARDAVGNELKQSGSLALLFMATALTILTIFILPDWKIPAQWPVALVILFVTSIWVTSSAIRKALNHISTLEKRLLKIESEPDRGSPKVITAVQSGTQSGDLTLLLQPNRLFGQSMLVSIYHEDDNGMELLVGEGFVASVQGNGLIQIAVRSWQTPYEHIRTAIISKNERSLSALIVRPAPTTNPTNEIALPLDDLMKSIAWRQFMEYRNGESSDEQ